MKVLKATIKIQEAYVKRLEKIRALYTQTSQSDAAADEMEDLPVTAFFWACALEGLQRIEDERGNCGEDAARKLVTERFVEMGIFKEAKRMHDGVWIRCTPQLLQTDAIQYLRVEPGQYGARCLKDSAGSVNRDTLVEFEKQCKRWHISPAQAIANLIARAVQEEKENARLAGEDEEE